MHLITLDHPYSIHHSNQDFLLPSHETLLCNHEIAKQLSLVVSNILIEPYKGPVIKQLDPSILNEETSLIVDGNLIDLFFVIYQLKKSSSLETTKLYTHPHNASFFNSLIGTFLFESLPTSFAKLKNPILYQPSLSYDKEKIKICQSILGIEASVNSFQTRDYPRITMGLHPYFNSQKLPTPLISQLISHFRDYERVVLWNNEDVNFFYPDTQSDKFDDSSYSLEQALDLLKKSDLYIGAYNHWMCLAILYNKPVLALSADLRVQSFVSNHPLSSSLPKNKDEFSCCYQCGHENSTFLCQKLCSRLKELNLDEITESIHSLISS